MQTDHARAIFGDDGTRQTKKYYEVRVPGNPRHGYVGSFRASTPREAAKKAARRRYIEGDHEEPNIVSFDVEKPNGDVKYVRLNKSYS